MNKKIIRDGIILLLLFSVTMIVYQLYMAKKKYNEATKVPVPHPSSSPIPAMPERMGKPSMESMMLMAKKNEVFQQWLQDARKNAKIEQVTDLKKTTGTITVVNGEKISAEEFQKRAKVRERMSMAGTAAHGQGSMMMSEEGKKRALEELLDKMIDEALLRQEAKELKIEVTDTEIEKMFQEKKANFSSDAEFEATLSSHGFTVDDIRAQLRRELLQEKVEEVLTRDVKVTEEDIKMHGSSEPKTTKPGF